MRATILSRNFVGAGVSTALLLANGACTTTNNISINGGPDSGQSNVHLADANDHLPVGDGNTVPADAFVLPGDGRAVPHATTQVTIIANLDSNDVPIADPNSLSGGQLPDFPMIVTVFDSLGATHVLTLDFYRSAIAAVPGDSEWTWTASANNSEITEAGGAPPIATTGQSVIAGGTLDFTTDGALDVSTVIQLSDVTFNAAAQQSIDFADHFGDAITPTAPSTQVGTGLLGTTQFAQASTVYAVIVDGGFTDGDTVNTADGHLPIDAGTPVFSLPDGARPTPTATTFAAIIANLDARDVAIDDGLNDGGQSPNFTAPVAVFDSLGGSHELAFDFFRSTVAGPNGDSEWNWTASANNSEISEANGVPPLSLDGKSVMASGTLDFTTNGALDVSSVVEASDVTFNFATKQVIDFAGHFGDPITPIVAGQPAGTGLLGITQFSSASTVYNVSVDGGF